MKESKVSKESWSLNSFEVFWINFEVLKKLNVLEKSEALKRFEVWIVLKFFFKKKEKKINLKFWKKLNVLKEIQSFEEI